MRLKADAASPPHISRRALLEGSVSSAVATVGWSGSATGSAAAADSAPGGGSPRQMAAFRIRQAAAQAYLDEPVTPL